MVGFEPGSPEADAMSTAPRRIPIQIFEHFVIFQSATVIEKIAVRTVLNGVGTELCVHILKHMYARYQMKSVGTYMLIRRLDAAGIEE
jgi:hypothetical protein